MKPKKLLIITSSLVMIAVIITLQYVLAWLYYYNTDFLLVTGDIQLSVKGWAQPATDESELIYGSSLISKENDFSFRDVSMDNFIAFKFEVTNETEKDAVLSMRFSDFSEYMFEHFLEYRKAVNQNNSINSDNPYVSQALEDEIFKLAETNTAKLATTVDAAYYIDVNGDRIDVTHDYQYTWCFSYGSKIFSGINLPGVVVDVDDNEIKSSVELYFIVRSNQNQESVEEYKRWLLGYTDSQSQYHVGYGQERIANMLGFTWAGLPAIEQKAANAYLDYFISCEFASIATIGEDGLAIISLNLKYFEFIGDNARP